MHFLLITYYSRQRCTICIVNDKFNRLTLYLWRVHQPHAVVGVVQFVYGYNQRLGEEVLTVREDDNNKHQS